MTQTIQIRCKNNKKTIDVSIGSSLSEIFSQAGVQMPYPPIVAKVNNRTKGLDFRLYCNSDVEYLDMSEPASQRAYTRTLFFVLCKAVHDLYPEGSVIINTAVSNGYYCELKINREVQKSDCDALRTRMQTIVHQALPITYHRAPTEEVIRMFEQLGTHSKVELLKSLGKVYTDYCEIDGYVDYFYGSLLENTSQLYLWDLQPYFDGLLLRVPDRYQPDRLGELTRQDKMFSVFQEHHKRLNLLGISTIGMFNQAVRNGHSADIIHVSEALQEKRLAKIASDIVERKGVRLVLIAGPSSSGKTTTCKRLAVQLVTNGIKPVQISLDDYFLDREQTPRDASGDYDFESIYSLNLPLINEQFTALFRGEEVELPRYDFPTGTSQPSGKKLHLDENQILIVEGIHALNPELTAKIPENQKYRVYASALTSILLDTHNYIPTTDNRLLRRIIRDAKYRGTSAQETIRRWPSVRAGENKWIFPYQENADAMFNTAMIYELAVIKQQAVPLLEQVPENCPEYAEAYRLLKFLHYITPIDYTGLPSTSLLREFLGGSSFEY